MPKSLQQDIEELKIHSREIRKDELSSGGDLVKLTRGRTIILLASLDRVLAYLDENPPLDEDAS